jgi:hypothetical protein
LSTPFPRSVRSLAAARRTILTADAAPAGPITREWAAQQSWPPQFAYEMFFWYTERYDPLTLSNPLWAKLMSVVSPIFWGPLFGYAIFGFIMGMRLSCVYIYLCPLISPPPPGDNLIRAPLLCWAGAASMSVGVLYTLSWIGGPGFASPNPLMMTLFWSVYLVGVPATMWRMWKKPFPNSTYNKPPGFAAAAAAAAAAGAKKVKA